MARSKELYMKKQSGFTLVELLVAMAITLVVVAATLGAFNDALRANEAVTLLADMDQNLRAGMNLVIRDLIQTGEMIPTGGIPIPSGAGAQPINRPSPVGSAYTFDTTWTALPAISPGASMGPVLLGQTTDMLTVLYGDNFLPLNQTQLASIADNGSSATVDPGTPITGINNAIRPGDLIMFSNAQGNAIQQVTSVAGQTMNFATTDAFNLNKRSAGQGTIMQLKTGSVWPPTTAARIWMITYYLDPTTNPRQPRLMRQVNFNPARPVAEVIENLQVSYDLVDNVTNPTNVKQPASVNSANQINKVNLSMSARSNNRFGKTGQYLRNSLSTQVSIRSLAYVDQYK